MLYLSNFNLIVKKLRVTSMKKMSNATNENENGREDEKAAPHADLGTG